MEAVSPPNRSFVLVSRARIAQNYRSVCATVGPGVEVVGVVKAGAYGHGAVEVSRILISEGARWLAVSSVDEGVSLRGAGVSARILVMAGLLPYEHQAVLEYGLTPTLHELADIAAIETLALRHGRPIAYHLKIDSGMGRLGTRAPAADIAAAISRAPHTKLEGLMTHFASAADYTSSQTSEQLAAFEAIRCGLAAQGIVPEYVHVSSTNAVGYGRREAWHNMVRVGHAIYGYVSPPRGDAPPRVLEVQPALTWKARIVAVKEIPEGALVGYGGSFRAPRPMRIAVLGAGYADGIFHRLSNRGRVIAAGKLAPILGTVSMDLTTIDVSHTDALGPGDEVTLLGSEGESVLDAQQIARVAGTISYNILCGINERVRRVYV
jgi:alanine racemase